MSRLVDAADVAVSRLSRRLPVVEITVASHARSHEIGNVFLECLFRLGFGHVRFTPRADHSTSIIRPISVSMLMPVSAAMIRRRFTCSGSR